MPAAAAPEDRATEDRATAAWPDSATLPLSFAQRRLWLLEQLEPGQATWLMSSAWRLEGAARPATLGAAWAALARRHEALRTSFPSRDGVPEQRVGAAEPPPPWGVVDLSRLAPRRREREQRQLIEAESGRAVDLTRGSLARMLILRSSARRHAVLLVLHHAIADGWSQEVLASELPVLDGAARQGRAAALPDVALQAADVALWRRSQMRGAELERHLSFWRRELADPPAPLELPVRRGAARPARRGARQRLTLPIPLTRRIEELGASRGATLFVTLLSTWGLYLTRLSAARDLVVGVPVAQRERAELEGVVGMLLDTLPLRLKLRGNPSFVDLLERVRARFLSAWAWRRLPFERLVEELGLAGQHDRHPLFQVFFNLHTEEGDATRRSVRIAGLRWQPVAVERVAAKLDLQLEARLRDGGIELALVYSPQLFDRTLVQRVLRALESLLCGAVAVPRRRLSDLPLLAPGERHQLLVETLDKPPRREPSPPLWELFAARAAAAPDTVAVVSGERTWSYGAVARRACALAGALRERGVALETVVALAMASGPELIVGMLATHAAGGAFVILDPREPAARRSALLAALRPHCTLDQTAVADLGAAAGDDPEAGWSCPEQLACVVATSGSSGHPKSVLHTLGGLVESLRRSIELHALEPSDTVLPCAAVSSDMALRELLAPLVAGARLVLAPDAARRDPAALLKVLCHSRVSCLLGCVPSLLRAPGGSGASRSPTPGAAPPGDRWRSAEPARCPAC